PGPRSPVSPGAGDPSLVQPSCPGSAHFVPLIWGRARPPAPHDRGCDMDVRTGTVMPAAAVLLAGCASGPSEDPATVTTGPTTPAAETAATARVTALDPTVSVLAVATGETKTVDVELDVAEGDTVGTDPTGLAEITFEEGSLTRLGPDGDLV